LTKILNSVSKKPEAIALINTLSKYPKVVNAIESGDITGLNPSELTIFDSLNVLDDNTLKVLVEYYSNIERESGSVFDYRRELTPDIPEDEIPAATNIDNAYSDSGIGTSSNITGAEGGIDDANEKMAIAMEAAKVFDTIVEEKNKDKRNTVMGILNEYRNIIFKNKNDEMKVLSMQGRKLLISYIVNNEVKTSKSSNPWRIINENDHKFFEKTEAAKSLAVHSDTGVKFLSSDPKVFMNKLKILFAEKKAGNNNVFDEISAISDELRRSGVLSL